jgi:hypothetical protein
VRDYIHVVDLALGHVAALKKMMQDNCGFKVYALWFDLRRNDQTSHARRRLIRYIYFSVYYISYLP